MATGRFLDNIFVERLWRSLKYEEVYLKAYADIRKARESIARWVKFYNFERPHQALAYNTPWEIYQQVPRFAPERGASTTATTATSVAVATVAVIKDNILNMEDLNKLDAYAPHMVSIKSRLPEAEVPLST